jgi:hypothetical protein
MTKEQLETFYNGVTVNTYGLLVNEYLIVKDKYTEEPVDAFRWDGQYYLSIVGKNLRLKCLDNSNQWTFIRSVDSIV